jgi:hypothetical protein
MLDEKKFTEPLPSGDLHIGNTIFILIFLDFFINRPLKKLI